MPHRASMPARAFDALFAFLTRPKVARISRWSFVVTLPLALLAADSRGWRPSVETGLVAMIAIGTLDLLFVVAVAAIGTRILGRERRDVLLDFLIHPAMRRAMMSELKVLSTFPYAISRRYRKAGGVKEFSYHRGSSNLGMAVALLPAALAEGLVIHLLLPDGWFWPKLLLAALGAYGAIMFVAWALGERVRPHRLGHGWLELRLGELYRVRVPVSSIAAVERRREREGQHSRVVADDAVVRMYANGRTDVRIVLTEPGRLERPVGEPVYAKEIAFAVDRADEFMTDLARADRPLQEVAVTKRRSWHGWLALADAAEAVTA